MQYPHSGAIALVGSGEYLPVMADLEGELFRAGLERGKRAFYIQLPTAAGQEDAKRLAHWHELGREQGQRLGVESQSLALYNREDAFNDAFVEAVEDAALIYLSGGDPQHLANSLMDTPIWSAIVRSWSTGSSLMGCSAGAMALGKEIVPFRNSQSTPGLGLLPNVQTIPHFDRFISWQPEGVSRVVAQVEESVTLIGIDENTALVREESEVNWRVWGRGKVHVLRPSETRSFANNDRVPIGVPNL